MRLSVEERLGITTLYVPKGDMIQMAIQQDIRKKVDILQDEMKRIKFVFVPDPIKGGKRNGYDWDHEKAKNKDIDFTQAERSFLRDRIEALDKTEDIDEAAYAVCVRLKEQGNKKTRAKKKKVKPKKKNKGKK